MPDNLPQPVPASKYTRDYYLASCDGFEEFRTSGTLPPRLQRAIRLARVDKGERVADIGCGRGEVVAALRRSGVRAIGLDYAPTALELASSTALSGCLMRAAVDGLPVADRSIDVAFLLDSVKHLTESELAACLAEAHRVLRTGGRLVVHTSPNRCYLDVGYRWYTRPVNLLINALAGTGLRPTSPRFPRKDLDLELHVNEQTPPSLRRVLRRAGFRVRCWADNYTEWVVGGKTRLRSVLNRLSPLSHLAPVSWLLANDIWAVAWKRP